MSWTSTTTPEGATRAAARRRAVLHDLARRDPEIPTIRSAAAILSLRDP